MSDEKRRHVRKRVDLAGTFEVGDQVTEVHISDMCPGGAFIEIDVIPAFGQKGKLTIELPGRSVVVDATVRWSKKNGMGVQFGRVGARDTYALTEYLGGLDPIPDSRRYEG